MQNDLSIFPETRVAFVVGTNVAFFSVEYAQQYLRENTVGSGSVVLAGHNTMSAVPPPIVMLPIGYLAKDTQVIMGEVPPHRPVEPAVKADEVPQKAD